MREQLILTLRGRDERGERDLETLLSWYEARKLANALLDALHPAGSRWPRTMRPRHQHARPQAFKATPSERSGEPVILSVVLGSNDEAFPIPLSRSETTQFAHLLLAEANPSRASSGDD